MLYSTPGYSAWSKQTREIILGFIARQKGPISFINPIIDFVFRRVGTYTIDLTIRTKRGDVYLGTLMGATTTPGCPQSMLL